MNCDTLMKTTQISNLAFCQITINEIGRFRIGVDDSLECEEAFPTDNPGNQWIFPLLIFENLLTFGIFEEMIHSTDQQSHLHTGLQFHKIFEQ